jgi:hypothetical protein
MKDWRQEQAILRHEIQKLNRIILGLHGVCPIRERQLEEDCGKLKDELEAHEDAHGYLMPFLGTF